MRRFRRMFGPEPAADVDAELNFHLEMRIRELVARGETPARARELALQRFGDFERSRQQCVEIDERRGRRFMRLAYFRELGQDVAYTLRTLRRAPAFTAVALLTLVLGIGANSAIFSVVYGVLLRGLPYPDADRLYRVRMLYPDGTQYSALSAPDFMSVRQDARAFDRVEAYSSGLLTMLGAGEPREVRGASVSDGLFDLLGFSYSAGRGFQLEQHQPGRASVAVLDHGFWVREFGSDPAVVGRVLRFGGVPCTIVGVLAPGARLTADADVYRPLEYTQRFSAATANSRRSEFLGVVARARAGADEAQVRDDVQRVGRQLQSAFPDTNGSLTFSAIRMGDLVVGDVRRPLFVLLGAVALVLLVACANVANLLLARGSARQQELSVRRALGATGGRLVRQLLTEAVVLGLAGAAGGLAVAFLSTRALVAAQPADIPRLDQIGVDRWVLLYTVGVALLTSVAFGLLPAMQSTTGLMTGLREGGRSGGASGRGHRLRSSLVVAEIALAVVLLTGAGLLIRSFAAMLQVDPGFKTEQGLAFRVVLQGENYQKVEQVRSRVAEIEERLRALPGVTAAGATSILPMSGLGAIYDFAVVGAPPPPPNVNQEIAVASVTPAYFAAVGTPLTRGRVFGAQDSATSPRVAIVNRTAVRRWFGDRDPLGRRVATGGEEYEVVGVVGDILQQDPGQPVAAQMFLPYAQLTPRSPRYVVRTTVDPAAMTPAIRAAVRAIDQELAIPQFTPLERLVATSVARPRFYMSLLALFAAAALALAATGVFGVMSYAVAQRKREITIRMALGAHARQVLWMIVGRAVSMAALGLALGLALALAAARALSGQLYGVGVADPMTLGAVSLVLGASAVLASFVPALRASRLDPGTALRDN